ncbi:2-C-methyl-D-erythritol 4-phosphate cytidylyltransferase [Luteolibacter sp. LG18]|uniref:2-C-methyl-D-erythritol 4-phosphate cytidylyltransferase n=1 Tax=Luteolibacter sp. LG18 TaxID=2819286 RepID=UPI002B305D51|nr:2-C-methyl-D-erythritol 4-phosphate cytidylyltransferase [Luteolibacter sp. LG18]
MSSCAIVVAAGSSRRMGFDKLAAPLAGVPVLRRSVEKFIAASSVSSVVVVAPQDRFDELLGGDFSKPVTRVDGGANRQDSVQNGLAAVPEGTTLVAIHDGARPLVTPEAIDRCLAAAAEHGAAALARPVTETLKRADADGLARESVDRELLWFMETPQCFQLPLIQRAYAEVNLCQLTVTDEVSAMEAIGIPTLLVDARAPNLKITHPSDLALAAALLNA